MGGELKVTFSWRNSMGRGKGRNTPVQPWSYSDPAGAGGRAGHPKSLPALSLPQEGAVRALELHPPGPGRALGPTAPAGAPCPPGRAPAPSGTGSARTGCSSPTGRCWPASSRCHQAQPQPLCQRSQRSLVSPGFPRGSVGCPGRRRCPCRCC